MITNNNNYSKNLNYETPYKTDSLLEQVKRDIDSNDIYLLTKLNNLRMDLSSSKLDIKNIKDQIKDLSTFKKAQNFDYLNNLLKPEKARGSKIPSQVPVPSCAFQLHNSVTISTNASGNCAFIFNPYFLADSTCLGAPIINGETKYASNFMTTLWVNNDSTLTGNGNNGEWIPTDISQTLPSVYNQYRLVSASIQVRYIGRLDEAAGVIGGAIILDELQTVGTLVQSGSYAPGGQTAPSEAPDLAKYGNFELARDSYYHQENACLEGLRMLYFPIDNSYEEYCNITNQDNIDGAEVAGGTVEVIRKEKMAFNWMFWAVGTPANKNCFKIDIFCNFECLPDPAFLNYMPISAYPFMLSPDEKKKFIMLVQSRPILKLNEERDDIIEVPDLFLKMISKFKNGLPGFDRLRACGLINAIPSLKPGLALAGNMISANAMDFD